MRFDRAIIPAFVVGCLILVAGAAGFTVAVSQLKYFLVKEPIGLRAPLASIPTTLGRWERLGNKDHIFSKEIEEELGTKAYLDRTYVVEGDPQKGVVSVHVAYYTGTIDDVPHIPDRCSLVHGYLPLQESVHTPLKFECRAEPSGQFNTATGLEYQQTEVRDLVTAKPTPVMLPLGDFAMRVSEFQDPKRPKVHLVAGYFFIANARMTPTPKDVRLLAFNRTERFAYYCKVQLSLEAEVQSDGESLMPAFVADSQSLLSSLVPPLMACLPDWTEVKRAANSTPTPSH